MSKRVLFLYISPSSGHQHASDAVREALQLISPTWETYGVDSFTFAYPNIGRWVAKTYLEILRRTPLVWDYLYDNPDVEEATREIRELLNVIASPRMKILLEKFTPHALVCTQAVPCSVFAAEKRRGHLSIPLIAVITDFAVHSYWVYPEVDLYCVASEDSKRELIRHGIPAARIVVTGIPISPSFLRQMDSSQARVSLHMDPHRQTLLLMGGSQGLGPMQETIDLLHPLPLQFIVACGLNRELFRLLKKRYPRDRRVRILGYTRNISPLMDCVDLLITKPGGLTSSEALAKRLPMIISNPIPGQEERNARYLLRQGVAERADAPEEIKSIIQSLIQHPQRLRKMSDRAKQIATPYAAMEVARCIYQMVTHGLQHGH